MSSTEPISKKNWIKLIKENPYNFKVILTPFFRAINKAVNTKNWVDIENEYYILLKKIVKKEPCGYNTPRQLDAEMKLITKKLTTYLDELQRDLIFDKIYIDSILKKIHEPIHADNVSIASRGQFEQFLHDRFTFLLHSNELDKNMFFFEHVCSFPFMDHISDIDDYFADLMDGYDEFPDSMLFSKHKENIYDPIISTPDCFLWPDQLLLLNFNYTRTADLYIPRGGDFEVNHIHGELGNEMNPIIFGYGDELDEDYKAISNLNDNDYLSHIKSIRYLETDNYRRLLTFIDSEPYQIYIMGHSCGNSDRTLLNTLFEHRNCVSIKPFYHLKADGSDNYIEIVQNISRNFNDKQSMRDRVVNKSYCQPLVTA